MQSIKQSVISFANFTDLGHFTDSSTGSLVTLDKHTGVVQWKVRIGSPIVALYLVQVFTYFRYFRKELHYDLQTRIS